MKTIECTIISIRETIRSDWWTEIKIKIYSPFKHFVSFVYENLSSFVYTVWDYVFLLV